MESTSPAASSGTSACHLSPPPPSPGTVGTGARTCSTSSGPGFSSQRDEIHMNHRVAPIFRMTILSTLPIGSHGGNSVSASLFDIRDVVFCWFPQPCKNGTPILDDQAPLLLQHGCGNLFATIFGVEEAVVPSNQSTSMMGRMRTALFPATISMPISNHGDVVLFANPHGFETHPLRTASYHRRFQTSAILQ